MARESSNVESIILSGVVTSDANITYKRSCIERSNLLNIAKICIKSLIDFSLSAGTRRIFTEEFLNLEQFFIVLEHVIGHGLKDKRTFLGPRQGFMGVLDAFKNQIESLPDILTNIRNLSDIKTSTGRTRAWMRLALMQKVLAEQMLAITQGSELLNSWYEENSILLSEEGSVIAGMLVGLHIFDYNFDLNGKNLDTYVGIIDISLYLRDGNNIETPYKEKASEQEYTNDQKMEMILDQKAYLEQLNKLLNTSIAELKQQVQDEKKSDSGKGIVVEELRNRLVSAIAEKEQCKKEYDLLLEEHNNKLETANADLNIERNTYRQSSTGLNDMYIDVIKQLEEVSTSRKELQLMLEEQQTMNLERQINMRLLEKNIHEKQDTLMTLRRQLEDIKKINAELYSKSQSSDTSLKEQMSVQSAMEETYSDMINQNQELEKRLSLAEAAYKQSEDIGQQIGAKLDQLQAEKVSIYTDLRVEHEWRLRLQVELDVETEKYDTISKEISNTDLVEKENRKLKERLEKAELRLSEQDTSLTEMETLLHQSQIEVNEKKELHDATKENEWLDDKNTLDCQACKQPFSIATRKHHCRNCGGIFCNSCSGNTMPLPSSSKPVRVCDICQETLVAKYPSIAS